MEIVQKELLISDFDDEIIKLWKDDEIIFDIETTGFSSKNSSVYMIGCLARNENHILVTQYFSEKISEEAAILATFNELLLKYKGVISFNGDQFDIPFLIERGKIYGFKSPLEGMTSYDLYKELKSFKRFFNLENMKQKSLEDFLNIERVDKYDGGELIKHYLYYDKSPNFYDLNLLLNHNYDDLLGLTKLLSMKLYLKVFEGDFEIISITREESRGYYGDIEENLVLECKLPYVLPKNVSYKRLGYYITLRDDRLILLSPIVNNRIKIHYPNYQDYYYLEEEDMAVLKDLTSSIDKREKTKCNPYNCYGKFLLNESNIKNYEIFYPYIKTVMDLLKRID